MAVALVTAGAVLLVVAAFQPWVRSWDYSAGAEDPALTVKGVSAGFLGHPLVLGALALLVVGYFNTSYRRLHWVLACIVGAVGLVYYWQSAWLSSLFDSDTDSWLEPGVPTATIGFLAVLTGTAWPYLSGGRPEEAARPQLAPGRLSLIIGLVGGGLSLWCFPVGLPFSVAAIVLGWRGSRMAPGGPAGNRLAARAGIISGLVGIGLAVGWVVLLLVPQ